VGVLAKHCLEPAGVGPLRPPSTDTMGQMNQAFRNIVNMLHGVRDGLIRDANNYEHQEQAS
jgi:hypothetical protein